MDLRSEYLRVKEETEELLGLNLISNKGSTEKDNDNNNCTVEIPNKNLIRSLSDHMQKIYDYDERLFNHSLAVSLIAAFIGRNLELTLDEIDELYIAGALHDIGKIYIPKKVIDKKGKLDIDERKIIEAHPAYSIWYLTTGNMEEKPQYYSRKILDMIRYHHEEVSGYGYPYGLKRNQINEGAKIIAIADKLEAYGAKRSYHEARTLKQCIEFIERQVAEGVLDSKITTATVSLLKNILEKGDM